MGYACPVCEDPQADAGHLANHLAFTALLHEGAHADWLDAHVPDWADHDEDALAEAVVDHATETEYPQVFEDTTGEAPAGDHADHPHADHDHAGHGHGDDVPTHGARTDDSHGSDPFDAPPEAYGVETPEGADPAEQTDIMKQARELTERRRSDGEGDTDADADEASPEADATDGSGDADANESGDADADESGHTDAEDVDDTSGDSETE
jgi:hypothetical protein